MLRSGAIGHCPQVYRGSFGIAEFLTGVVAFLIRAPGALRTWVSIAG